jgi:hypothetical protein
MNTSALVVVALFGGALALEVGVWSVGYLLGQLYARREAGRK